MERYGSKIKCSLVHKLDPVFMLAGMGIFLNIFGYIAQKDIALYRARDSNKSEEIMDFIYCKENELKEKLYLLIPYSSIFHDRYNGMPK